MKFLLLIFIVFTLFSLVLCLKSFKKHKIIKLNKPILILLLFSIIITISLGVNYVGAYNNIEHTVDINNFLSYLIIGKNNPSLELFKNYFDKSILVDIVLLIGYAFCLIFEI